MLALTLAKNGVPVRIIEKDGKFHEGQRGAGVQPRTMEVYNYLGIAEDIIKAGQPLKSIAVYKMPEGREVIKTITMMKSYLPTPSVPLVSTFCISFIFAAYHNISVEPSSHRAILR